MKTAVHPSESRGFFDHGWLKTYHTFSFANYYNPSRMHFGKLRVLNDDVVAPAEGFGTHRHENMEVVSIPLSGSLTHKDSEGKETVIQPNDVQVMSTGTSMWHSEHNPSGKEALNFLQIWVSPYSPQYEPRYTQQSFDPEKRKNTFQTIISPEKEDGTLCLNQDVTFSFANMSKNYALDYNLKSEGNGIYLFVIDGTIAIEGEQLKRRDGIGIWETKKTWIEALSNSEILLMEVPMN